MAEFRYSALDARGELVSGRLEADSIDQARNRLKSQGLQVQSIEPARESSEGASAPRVSPGQRAELSGYLASLAGAGVPLGPALRALAEEMGSGPLAVGLRRLAEQIDRGESPEKAFRAVDPAAASLLEGLIAAGGKSGRLAELLNELVAAEAVERQLRWRAWLSLVYPTLIIAAAVLLFCVSFAVAIRRINDIYVEFDIDLPPITQAIIALAHPAVTSGLTAAGLVLCAGLLVLPMRVFPGSDDVLMALPGLGKLYRSINCYRLIRLLGMLLEGGVPLPEAFRLVASGVTSRRLAKQCRKAVALAQSGRSLAESLQGAGLGLVAVAIGNPAKLPADAREVFRAGSDWFEARARIACQMIETLYPPVVFVGMWLGLSVIVPGLFVPLIHLISALS